MPFGQVDSTLKLVQTPKIEVTKARVKISKSETKWSREVVQVPEYIYASTRPNVSKPSFILTPQKA